MKGDEFLKTLILSYKRKVLLVFFEELHLIFNLFVRFCSSSKIVRNVLHWMHHVEPVEE